MILGKIARNKWEVRRYLNYITNTLHMGRMIIICVIYLSLSGHAKVPNILVIKNSWKDESALIELNYKSFDAIQRSP